MHDQPTDQVHDRPGAQTIADAAAQLGISQNAVRMRIRRGTLSGFKSEDGRWYVHTTDQVHNETDQATSAQTDHVVHPTDQALTTARGQLDMIRDEWLQPLINQIGSLQNQLGRVEGRNEHLEAENAELRRQLEEARHEAPQATETGDTADDEQRPGRRWWEWWKH